MGARVAAAKQEAELQRKKREEVELAAQKREAERQRIAAELESCKEEEAQLLEKMNRIRQRDTVIEYTENLKTKSDAESLKYLTTMVSTVEEPWRILVEIARLRDFHRAQLDSYAKERAASQKKERELRQARAEHERTIAELQKELGRGNTSQQRDRGTKRSQAAADMLKGLLSVAE